MRSSRTWFTFPKSGDLPLTQGHAVYTIQATSPLADDLPGTSQLTRE
jgi:hypothetical protein